jgi:hypothetical protein
MLFSGVFWIGSCPGEHGCPGALVPLVPLVPCPGAALVPIALVPLPLVAPGAALPLVPVPCPAPGAHILMDSHSHSIGAPLCSACAAYGWRDVVRRMCGAT